MPCCPNLKQASVISCQMNMSLKKLWVGKVGNFTKLAFEQSDVQFDKFSPLDHVTQKSSYPVPCKLKSFLEIRPINLAPVETFRNLLGS